MTLAIRDEPPSIWLIAALYSVLTILLTFPLAFHPGSTLVGSDPDYDLFMWTLAWDTHAFTSQPLGIFDANIYFPYRHTLAYSENLIGSAFLAAPVLWLSNNPILAVNFVAHVGLTEALLEARLPATIAAVIREVIVSFMVVSPWVRATGRTSGPQRRSRRRW